MPLTEHPPDHRPSSAATATPKPAPRQPRPTPSACIAAALAATAPPPPDPTPASHLVPTSIERAGPGNYGRKEVEDGHTIVLLNDDVLTSVANATVVLEDGNDLERITVLYQFPQFLEHCPADALHHMVPRICARCPAWPPDLQVAAAEALAFVVTLQVPPSVAKRVVVAALQMTAPNPSNMPLFDICGEIVATLLPQVHRYDVLDVVVPQAVSRAADPNPFLRRLAARIIGSLHGALSALELDAIFLDITLTLADDPDPAVRAITAQSLASLAVKLPLTAVEQLLWPKLHALLDDSELFVRGNALRSIAKSAHAHCIAAQHSPTYSDLLLPLFIAESRRAAKISASDLRAVDDDTYCVLEVFSEVYGLFIVALAILIERDKLWDSVLSTLRLMVTCNGPTVRHWCAFNLPAVASVCVNDMTKHLTGIVHTLAGDTDLETRTTLAAGIHEVTRSLRNGELRNDIIRAVGLLFMDDNAQVRMNALGHFSEMLQLLSPGEKANLEDFKSSLRSGDVTIRRLTSEHYAEDVYNEADMRRLAPIFSSLELLSFDSWRTQKLLAEEVEKSAHLIPQEMLCEHVAPLLFQMARESTFLVRKASMRALVHVLRYVPDVRRRNHIFKHFRQQWAHSKVYWTRVAFLEAAECAYRMYSQRLFTTLFKDDVLAMRADSVVNVRLRLLRLCREVLPAWGDSPELRGTVASMTEDSDAQVVGEARALMKMLDNCSSSSYSSTSTEGSKLDREKERAEELFFVHQTQQKKKREQHNSYTETASVGEGDDGTDGRLSYDTTTTYETRAVETEKRGTESTSEDDNAMVIGNGEMEGSGGGWIGSGNGVMGSGRSETSSSKISVGKRPAASGAENRSDHSNSYGNGMVVNSSKNGSDDADALATSAAAMTNSNSNNKKNNGNGNDSSGNLGGAMATGAGLGNGSGSSKGLLRASGGSGSRRGGGGGGGGGGISSSGSSKKMNEAMGSSDAAAGGKGKKGAQDHGRADDVQQRKGGLFALLCSCFGGGG